MLGIRVSLVIEVMDKPRRTPAIGILAEFLRVSAHGRFYREHVLPEGVARSVLVHQREGLGARGERLISHSEYRSAFPHAREKGKAHRRGKLKQDQCNE